MNNGNNDTRLVIGFLTVYGLTYGDKEELETSGHLDDVAKALVFPSRMGKNAKVF